ncbi:MAG: hypothetical protein L6R38_009272 [Xanthoria sp. 2 TBL-2021]|nr:MAG: hypothetical protein L6R38_009272 [Xanthoria sp. 2 TBL-2021]
MAVEVMRMPITEVFAHSDVAHPRSLDDLQIFPKDFTAAFEPRHSSERVGLKASVRSVLSAPLPIPTEDNSPLSSPKAEPDDRRASIGSLSGDIDMLVSQLDQTKIQTAAPSSSKNVRVPKGYGLGLAYDSSLFYKQRSEARRFDKRKRDLGVLPKHTGPQKHGFRPEELLWYGAMELEDCKDSTLDNEIHPLLDRDRFDDTPDHIYDQLIPGLRLASLFLSHPSCMQFWVTLAKGERRVDHVMSERYHKPRHRISRNVPMTTENVKEVIGYMKDLGNAKAIHFTFANGLTFQDSSAFGTAHIICNFQSDLESHQAGNVQRCHVRLHSDFYIIAKKLSTMVYPDPAQKLRFNLILATLIVHEMAHAIELSQWRNRAPSPFEPFFLHHNEAELGRMWESYVFGGQTSPINDRVDGIYGVSTWDWPRPLGEMNPERTICYALPMKFIENIQQKSTWQQAYELENCQTRFHVPRDGATSIYMNSVTTVSWTEEERVAKETLQEQQAQDSEEPAKKKRETADGKAMPIKDIGAEPENVEKKLEDEVAEGTVAQQVKRVKREPMGVLSRKQRRMQRKKLEQSNKNTALLSQEEKRHEKHHEVLLDLEDPDVVAVEEAVDEREVEIAKEGDGVVKDAGAAVDAVPDDDGPGVDVATTTTKSRTIHSAPVPAAEVEVQVEVVGKTNVTDTTEADEEPQKKDV